MLAFATAPTASSFEALSVAIFGTTTALSTFLSVAAGVGAIVGVVAIIDALTVSGKEAAKAADEAAQAHQEAVAKVEPLKQKLQEINDKIKEIQSKDKITLTDQQDLERLKEQRDVLQEDIELAERMAEIRSRESVAAAKEAIAKGGSDALDWRHQTDNDLSSLGLSDEDRRGAGWKYDPRPGSHHRWDYDKISETAALANAYSRYEAEQKRLQDEYSRKHDSDKWSERDEQANLQRQSEVEGYLKKISPALTANQEALQKYRAEFVNTNNVAREGCEDLVFRIDQVNNAIKGVTPDPFVDFEKHIGEVIRLANSGDWGSAELQHFLGLLTGIDFSSMEEGKEKTDALQQAFHELMSAPEGSSGKFTLANFFQGDEQKNLEQFWQTVEEIKSDWGEFNEETGELNFNIPSVKELADALGLSEDIVESIIQKTEQAGAEVKVLDRLGNETMDTVAAEKQLKKSGVIEKKVEINMDPTNIRDADLQIEKIVGGLDKLAKTKDGKIRIDTEDGKAAYTLLSQLYEKKAELSRYFEDDISFNIDTSKISQVTDGLDSADVKKFIDQVNEAKSAIQNLNDAEEMKTKYNLDIDTTQLEKNAKEAVANVKETLAGLESEGAENGLDITGTLNLKQEGLDPKDLAASLSNLQSLTAEDFTVTLGVNADAIDGYNPEDKSGTSLYDAKESQQAEGWKPPDKTGMSLYDAKESFQAATWTPSIKHGIIKYDAEGPGKFQGTAHVTGTAYAGGNWGLKRGEYALTGELGPELVVSNGRWQTVGDHGAEFANLPKGAIVFNHKQTEQLLKYGHINSRGKALASGNAFAPGSGYSISGSIFGSNTDKSGSGKSGSNKADGSAGKAAAKQAKKAAADVSKAAKDVSDTASAVEEESSKTADWVEKVLENLEKKADKYISRAEKKAENGNYAGAAKQYRKAEQVYANEMSKQKDAEGIYAAQAAKVLKDAVAQGKITDSQSKDIERKVANGAMELSKLSEGTEKVVSEYEEYYDKAIAAADATAEIYDKYEEVAKSLYQLPLDQVEEDTKQLDNEMDLLEKRLELTNESTKKTALMEEQMANARAKHAAQIDSYDKAHNNYITALRKVNETSDKALKGLTESQKQMITELVAAGEKIDYSSIVGASDEAKRAIIDYNASLEVQRQALYDVQMSSMETTLSLRELAAAIANQPIEDANAQIDKRQRPREVRNAQYDVAQTAEEQNRLLGQDIAGAKRDLKSREDALNKVADELDKAWNDGALVAFRNTAAGAGKKFGEKITENEVAAVIQELSKTGKLRDDNGKVVKKGSEEYRKAYDQMLSKARDYNAGLAARNTAQYDYDEQAAKTQKLIQDNALQRVTNVENESLAKRDKIDKQIESVDAGIEALGHVMDTMKNLDPEAAQQMADLFESTYGFALTPNDYYTTLANAYALKADWQEQRQTASNNIAGNMQEQYDLDAAKMSAEQRAETEAKILGYAQEALKDAQESAATRKQANDAYDEASPEGIMRREATQNYADYKYRTNEKTAEGKTLDIKDYQEGIDILSGKTDEYGNKVKGLIELTGDKLHGLEEQMQNMEPGTEGWDELQQEIAETREELNGLKSDMQDLSGGIVDAIAASFQDALDKNAYDGEMLEMQKELAQTTGTGSTVAIDMAQISNSKERVQLLSQEKAELESQRQTVAQTSTAYAEIDNRIRAIDKEILQNVISQAKWKKEAQDTVVGDVKGLFSGAADAAGGIASIAEAMKEMLDKILDEIENHIQRAINKILNQLAHIDLNIGRIERRYEVKNELGIEITAEDYITEAQLKSDKLKKYELEYIPELEHYAQVLKGQVGSDRDPDGSKYAAAYQKWQSSISTRDNLYVEMMKLLHSGLATAILEPLEKADAYIQSISDQVKQIGDLVTDDMLYDSVGNITEDGERRLAVLAGQYRAVQQEYESTLNGIRAIEAQVLAGNITYENVQTQLSEQQQKLVDYLKEQQQLALNMVEVQRLASENEVKNLQKVIDARQDALRAKKEYYDYDQRIRGKTRDIQTLQAQIAALNGLVDAESKAKKARLEAELQDATDELDQMVREHEFDISSKALDKLSDTIEEANKDKWDSVINSLANLTTYAQSIASGYTEDDIYEALAQILSDAGVKFSQESGDDVSLFSTFFRDNLKAVLSGDYARDQYVNAIQKYNTVVDELKQTNLFTDVAKIAAAYDDEALINGTVAQTQDGNIEYGINTRGYDMSIFEKMVALLNGDVVDGVSSGKPGLLSAFAILPDEFVARSANSVANSKIASLFGGKEHLQDVSNEYAEKVLELAAELQKKQLFGKSFWKFASGKKRVTKDMYAWTQEGHKEEWIVRQSDGAILTPLSKGDGVLPANLTSRLWDLATGTMPAPQVQMPSFSIPDYNISQMYAPAITNHFDNLINVEGNVDATVIDDLKQFTRDLAKNKDLLESAYQYTSNQMYKGYLHSGGKRRL